MHIYIYNGDLWWIITNSDDGDADKLVALWWIITHSKTHDAG